MPPGNRSASLPDPARPMNLNNTAAPAAAAATTPPLQAFTGPIGIAAGLAVTAGFYATILAGGWSVTDRYFMGHPVAIAATTLFFIAAAVLATRAAMLIGQRGTLSIDDADLAPAAGDDDSPASRFGQTHDAAAIATAWLSSLSALPVAMRRGPLGRRLVAVLQRQADRGSASGLSDDLREAADRQADADHDAGSLVRTIVWAIPMLGFLGTVIGITQTLGGLDFTDGQEAVKNLKTGLYVAFDTTALGLVLSVAAIFLQLPVDRLASGVAETVDARAAALLLRHLPSANPADDGPALIRQLCAGIEAAVQQSIAVQATLWRETIAEARDAWTQQQARTAETLQTAIGGVLVPSLQTHGRDLATAAQNGTDASSAAAGAIKIASQTIDRATERLAAGVGEVSQHRSTLIKHTEAMTALTDRLAAAGTEADQTAGRSAEAMRALARAIDLLVAVMPAAATAAGRDAAAPRRAAA